MGQSGDDAHRGYKLNSDLELVERHKLESDLRAHYVEKGKTLKELEAEWGTSRGAIHYWMEKFGIARRPHVATCVQRASFGLDRSGYERAQSRIPGTRKNDSVQIHQLVAIADGADPYKVFSNGEYHVHHRTGVPWDNRLGNVELLSREQHQRAHRRDEWTTENGYPVLATGRLMSEEEYHATWGPGVPDSHLGTDGQDPADDWSDSVYEPDDVWGPGVPESEV